MTETETITGEVQNIKDNNIAISNVWYNNKFKKLPEFIKKGSNVTVTFIKKGKNNYWQEITMNTVIELDITNELKNPIPKETINTLIMQSVQHSNNLKIDLDKATKEVIKSYKKIIEQV